MFGRPLMDEWRAWAFSFLPPNSNSQPAVSLSISQVFCPPSSSGVLFFCVRHRCHRSRSARPASSAILLRQSIYMLFAVDQCIAEWSSNSRNIATQRANVRQITHRRETEGMRMMQYWQVVGTPPAPDPTLQLLYCYCPPTTTTGQSSCPK